MKILPILKISKFLILLILSLGNIACSILPLTTGKSIPVQYRNVMLEALTQRDWLSVNELGLSTLHSFRVNDHGVIVKYIQFSEQNFSLIEAQKILNKSQYTNSASQKNRTNGNDQIAETNSNINEAGQISIDIQSNETVDEANQDSQLPSNTFIPAVPLPYKKSKEYYTKEVPDGYQLDLSKTTYVRFALSPENRLIRIVHLNWQESHVYGMTPIVKLQEYDDGVF